MKIMKHFIIYIPIKYIIQEMTETKLKVTINTARS